jgi:hypothetical protein
MKTSSTNLRLRQILYDIGNGSLIPRPEFQRRLIWADKHKNAFIETVVEHYPFPEIYIAAGDVDTESARSSQMLVDGQQRITTLHEYFTGSPNLRLRKDIVPYASLSERQKIEFLDYEVAVRDLGNIGIEEIKRVFERINSTRYALNAMEIHNARYDGALKRLAEGLAELDFFEIHRIFSVTDVRRMNDVVFVAVLLITMMSTYFHRDDEIETYLKQYNDEFSQKDDLCSQFKGIVSFISDCRFEDKSRVWKKADLFTLMVEVHRLLSKKGVLLDPNAVRENLELFYDVVDGDGQDLEHSPLHWIKRDRIDEYRKDTLQGTNDRSSRIRRGKLVGDILEWTTSHGFLRR